MGFGGLRGKEGRETEDMWKRSLRYCALPLD